MYRFLFILLPLLPCSCSLFSVGSKVDVIAEVGKYQLLASEFTLLIPYGLPLEDSLAMQRQYINNWALAHLMEDRAQKELPKELKDVTIALEEYRRSLLVYQYEKSYIETRIDTTVTQEELNNVYRENEALFTLTEPIAKVRYMKIALTSPNLEMVRSLYRTQSMEETYQLEQMAQNSVEKYELYNNQWINASTLSRDLPLSSDEVVRFFNRGSLECSDTFYAYFVAFLEMTPVGAIGPIEYEEVTIRNIILGRRKQELLKNLEKEVLEEGYRTKKLKVNFNQNE